MRSFKNFVYEKDYSLDERRVIGRPHDNKTIKKICDEVVADAKELKKYITNNVGDDYKTRDDEGGDNNAHGVYDKLDEFVESIKRMAYQSERLRKGASRIADRAYKKTVYSKKEILDYLDDVVEAIG